MTRFTMPRPASVRWARAMSARSTYPNYCVRSRADGLFVIIMNGAYYISGGFESAFRQLENDGLWRIRKLEEFNYMTQLERPGWLLVAEKQQ